MFILFNYYNWGDGTAICIIYPVLYSQRNSPSISHTSILSYYIDQQCFKMLAIYQVFRQQMTRANNTLRGKKPTKLLNWRR